MKGTTWNLKEIVQILKARQNNEFDCNIAVSGDRGNGKSTLINKMLRRFKGFRPWKHQVYSRPEVIKLLTQQVKGICWDDEAVNSGYKRDFQNKGQQELIKILTAYRDNYNIIASAIPNFFSLDKDLRDLFFLHIHIIERGIAIIHMPLQGRLYSQDRWDAKYNAKVEDSWGKKAQSNPDFRPPFYRLTTFRGYLFFSDVTEKQKQLYKQIKREKRAQAFNEEMPLTTEQNFYKKVYKQLIDKQLSKEFLMKLSLLEGKKFSAVTAQLNVMLKDNGILRYTLSDYLEGGKMNPIHNKDHDVINNLIPDF